MKDEFKAFLEIYPELVVGEKSGLLTGKTIAVKDNILVEGQIASAGSKMLENYRASYDATVIKKLKAAGATFVGRTNMDEFAMGSSTENSAYGPTLNPHDPTRVPGGSSGGSATAVAAGLAWAALGSDTGGSIRQPAAHCGVVGLKPTYGAVSRFGLIALASSLDQIGTFTTRVTEAELLFEIIAGVDENDNTTVSRSSTPTGESNSQVPIKFKIGVPRRFLATGIDSEVSAAFEASLSKLKDFGHKVIDIDLPHIEQSLPAYYIILPAEASSNLSRFDGLRYGTRLAGDDLLTEYLKTRGKLFGPEVRRRIMIGTYVLSAGYYDAYYGRACAVRELIKKSFAQAFTKVDAIATPTTTTPAFKFGDKADPLQMYLEDVLTVPANIAGIPGISVPMGKTKNNLPLGFQLMSAHFREDILFALGKMINNEK